MSKTTKRINQIGYNTLIQKQKFFHIDPLKGGSIFTEPLFSLSLLLPIKNDKIKPCLKLNQN